MYNEVELMMSPTLDALLLYALSIPIVMQYRLLPIDGTPYWLFGILFIVLTTNVVISGYPNILGAWKKHLDKIKDIILVIVLSIVLVGVLGTAMVDRARTAPVYGVHDIILQQEAAMRYLIVGKNPYKETYFGTQVESFNYDEPGDTEAVNPALYHFVMPPWYLLFPFSFYYSARPVLGYFDGRFVSLFCMIALLLIIRKWFRHPAVGRSAIILSALSPAVFDYFIEGRSDVFAFFWLVFSLFLLERKKYIWSAVVVALAFMSKQTTWFVFPFYFVYMWVSVRASIKRVIASLSMILIVVMILAIPFMVWDSRAFLNSVIFYLSGNAPHSYPVSGYGLSMVLKEVGIISDIHAYYPFAIWQAVFGIPALLGLSMWLHKSPAMSKLLIAYGVLLTIIWYTSRYFNNSHLGYISMIFVLGLAKDADEQTA